MIIAAVMVIVSSVHVVVVERQKKRNAEQRDQATRQRRSNSLRARKGHTVSLQPSPKVKKHVFHSPSTACLAALLPSSTAATQC